MTATSRHERSAGPSGEGAPSRRPKDPPMSLGIAVVALIVLCVLLLSAAVDRTSRANAWRRIAEERRWNTDRYRSGS
jgi:hypothetical protein